MTNALLTEIINLTQDLIRFPTTSDNPKALEKIIKHIEKYAQQSHLSTRKFSYKDKPSVLISLTSAKPAIVLNGHADVVPANPNQFKPQIIGKKLYGRGSQDMKSGLATMLVLAKHLKLESKNLPLSVMVVTDEEIGGFNGTAKLVKNYKSDFFLAGESTDLKIEYEAKGPLWLKIKTIGKRAHAAYLWEGENAILKLTRELNTISKLFPQPKSAVWKTTCNIGKITGGLAINQVPGEAEAILDIRRIPQDSADKIIKLIGSKLVHKDTSLEIVENEPTHQSSKTNPYVISLAKSVKKITQKRPEFIQKSGASDARHYSAHTIPAVCFGPSGSGLHTDKEWVDISSLETYYYTLKDFVISSLSSERHMVTSTR